MSSGSAAPLPCLSPIPRRRHEGEITLREQRSEACLTRGEHLLAQDGYQSIASQKPRDRNESPVS